MECFILQTSNSLQTLEITFLQIERFSHHLLPVLKIYSKYLKVVFDDIVRIFLRFMHTHVYMDKSISQQPNEEKDIFYSKHAQNLAAYMYF